MIIGNLLLVCVLYFVKLNDFVFEVLFEIVVEVLVWVGEIGVKDFGVKYLGVSFFILN